MDANCSQCSKAISDAEIVYSGQGNPLCIPCNQQAELLELDQRAAGNITKAAGSAIGLGFLSWVFNPFLLITIGAFSSALYALKSLRADNERFNKHLKSPGLVVIMAVFGMFVASARFLLAFVVTAATH
jgi:hypothetical protein